MVVIRAMNGQRSHRVLRKIALIVPLFIFLVLSFLAMKKGQDAAMKEKASELWKKRQWPEIVAMADNLSAVKKENPNILCYGTLAADQLHDSVTTEKLADRFLEQRALNLALESSVASVYTPPSIRRAVELHRTRIVLSFLSLLLILNLLAIRRGTMLTWITTLSIAGCVVLIL